MNFTKSMDVNLYYIEIYRVSQEECDKLRESVPYVTVYRYNPKQLYPKMNGYGDKGKRKVWFSCGSTYCTCSAVTSPVHCTCPPLRVSLLPNLRLHYEQLVTCMEILCSPICHFLVLLGDLTFMGPCIVSTSQYISNKMQRYTFNFNWKLLYIFRVVFPPIIRSAYNCLYSIWYLSHRYCYLPLSFIVQV
jgi:hypothetical protein